MKPQLPAKRRGKGRDDPHSEPFLPREIEIRRKTDAFIANRNEHLLARDLRELESRWFPR
jgi:hypothetical protein